MTTSHGEASHRMYTAIQRVARARAGEPAIVFGERVVTYDALLARGSDLARKLGELLGDEQHRLVAILGSPGPGFIASILAVLENRWTYLPLDIHHPRRRNDRIVADAGVDAILTVNHDDGDEVADDVTITRAAAPGAATSGASLDDRVYAIYTSGSTGAPKGSAASAAAILNVVDFMRERLDFTASKTMLSVTNFAWDLSVPDIYLPLTTGGRLVIATRGAFDELSAVAGLIDHHAVDLMQASPSMWKLLVESGWSGRSSLTAVSGGEALPETLAAELIPRCAELWNFYGPAECTVWSTCARVQKPDHISLGLALPNTGLYLVDENDRFVTPGEAGEILISGIGVANGYLNRPALTAEKFITLDTPTGPVAAYRTGDLGYQSETGELFFQGRGDLMLKIRGHRVEPREIEDHLERHPSVRRAVVFGGTGSVSDTLCAVLEHSAPLETRDVRAYLHELVPDFMIPTEVEFRDELPLNANMKLDRTRVISEFQPSAATASVTPRDIYELELLDMLSAITKAPFGLDDPLFDGALDSLSIVRLAQRINLRIDGALTFADLQQNPTVKHLAAFLRRARTSEFRQLVEFRPGTTGRTLVLFHPGGGTCLPYKPLIDALPETLKIVGVECPNLYRPRPELFSVEEMVERYYPDVAAIDARGPIGLGGWSLGGYIGYEVARRMRAEGREVGLVLLMDSVIIDDQLQEFARIVGKPNVSEFLRGHFAGYWELLDDAERERQRVTHELALDATLAYQPGPYDGDIVLAKAGNFDELPPGSDIDRMQTYVRSLAQNGWDAACSGTIRVEHTPTKHNDLVSAASAPMLAALISSYLE